MDRRGQKQDGGSVSEVESPIEGDPAHFPHVESSQGDSHWKGDLMFTAAVAGLFALLILRIFPDLLDGQLMGTDSQMRLVRVRRLAGPGGWFDGTIPRSNAPFGETLHWTRPLDVLILLGAWGLEPLLGFQRALHLSGVLIAPVLLIWICFATAWTVRPLTGGRVRYYAMLAVLAQVGIMGYALPGRADHNMLILLAFVAMLGSALRVVLNPEARWYSWATGASSGFGLWVSTEFLMPMFILLASLLVLWIWKGSLASRARLVSVALLAVIVTALFLEHPPGSLLEVEYDRISIVHVLIAGMVTAFWSGAASEPSARLDFGGRTTYSILGIALGTVLMLAIFPRFFGGPMVDVHPELKRTWLPYITEFQAYLVPDGISGIGRILAYLGHALVATAVVVHGAYKSRDPRSMAVWVLLGVGLIILVPLGIRWIRFVAYPEVLGVIGTMVLLDRILHYVERRFSGVRLSAARVFATAGLIAGPLLAGAGVMAVGGEAGRVVQQAAATELGECPVDDLVSILNDSAHLGDRPRTVLAHVDLGPALLYQTRHSVVATPYHRNWEGILDWQRIMATQDLDEARRRIRSRGIDLVITCGNGTSDRVGVESDPERFSVRLSSGTYPDWLRKLQLSTSAEGLRIYEVISDSQATSAGESHGYDRS